MQWLSKVRESTMSKNANIYCVYAVADLPQNKRLILLLLPISTLNSPLRQSELSFSSWVRLYKL